MYEFNIDELNKIYTKWNKENVQISNHGDFVEITTPFVDNHHDLLQIVMFYKDNKIILSDDGYTLSELDLYEIDYKKSPKRKEFLTQTLNSFGVSINNSELTIIANSLKEYPQKLLKLLQCILRISDMLMTSRSNVTSIFYEEVAQLFDDYDIPYTPDIGITGVSGNSNNFDFIIPKSKKQIEKIIKTINKPSNDNYKYPLLSFLDIKDIRNNSDYFIIANDSNSTVNDRFKTSFNNHGISVLNWSKKEEWIKKIFTA